MSFEGLFRKAPIHPEVERRALCRYFAEHFPAVQVVVRSSFQPFRAYVRDFSASGLGLVCERFLQPGVVVAIQLRRRQIGVSAILSAEVRHCTALVAGIWLCGLRLLRRLTPDELYSMTIHAPREDGETP
jgi:hypothetical protein